jgi:SpoVK/Ycf46/Vps4 family AAA+-type ATPase
MRLPDECGRTEIFEHYLRGLKLDPRLLPDRLAAEMAGTGQRLTGADIAFVCHLTAMFCVKDAVRGSNEAPDIAITRRHFGAAGASARSAASELHAQGVRSKPAPRRRSPTAAPCAAS